MNEEIRTVMKRILKIPKSGLHKILQEGLVEGKEKEYHALHDRLYSALVEKALHDADPKTPVTPDRIEHAQRTGTMASVPVIQSWNAGRNRWQTMSLSSLARVGVGNVLKKSDGVHLVPAEDLETDRNAEWAERYGSQAEYRRWVLEERNRWFVKYAIRMREQLVHLLVGHSHDLRPDIERVHASEDERISHVVITPRSVGSTPAQY